MPDVRCQVVLSHVSGLSRDSVVNTFHFASSIGTPISDTADDVLPRITNFFNGDGGAGDKLSSYISALISRTAPVQLKFYALGQSPGNPPDQVRSFVLGDAFNGTQSEPPEIACCLSYRSSSGAVMGGGNFQVPVARRSGRLYLGPLHPNAGANITAGRKPFATNFIARLLELGPELIATNTTDATWVVRSTVEEESFIIDEGWVDDDWDVQRRRGQRATGKFAWT